MRLTTDYYTGRRAGSPNITGNYRITINIGAREIIGYLPTDMLRELPHGYWIWVPVLKNNDVKQRYKYESPNRAIICASSDSDNSDYNSSDSSSSDSDNSNSGNSQNVVFDGSNLLELDVTESTDARIELFNFTGSWTSHLNWHGITFVAQRGQTHGPDCTCGDDSAVSTALSTSGDFSGAKN